MIFVFLHTNFLFTDTQECEPQLLSTEALEGDNIIVYFQCSNCTLLFTDEESHANHLCPKHELTRINPQALDHMKVESSACDLTDRKENLILITNVENLTNKKDGSVPQENVLEPFSSMHDRPNSTVFKKELVGSSSKTPLPVSDCEKTQTPWTCSMCFKSFKFRYDLVHHLCEPPSLNSPPRGTLGKPTYTCPTCENTYTHKKTFLRHISRKCNAIKRSENTVPPFWTRPLPSSVNVKEFQCEKCKRYFGKKYYLVHHACIPPSFNPLPRDSLGKPPFLCPSCGVLYQHKTSYCRHIHHECGKGRKYYKKKSQTRKKKITNDNSTNEKDDERETNARKETPPPISLNCMLCNTEFHDKDSLEVHIQEDHLTM